MSLLCIKNRKKIFGLGLLLFFFINIPSFAQTRTKKSDLENKKKRLQKDIEYTNQLLIETKNNRKTSVNQLVTLNKKINAREELIVTINKEISLLNNQIGENNTGIVNLKKDLKKLKEEYAKMIYYAYENQDAYNKLMFIFSARDFNQAYMRLKYLQQYTEYRHRQAEAIENTQVLLTKKIQELEEKKTYKQQLLSSEKKEKSNLTEEKKEKEIIVSQLQDKEQQLKKDLQKKEKYAKKLEQAIQRMIEEEIRRQQASNREKRPSEKTKTTPRLELTPEAQELSTTFANNQGRLPWPVTQGIITEQFGEHEHPTLKGIKITNNGVDISSNKGALARSIFSGEVTGVANIPGSGKVVIVRHGEFLSVYSNLDEVFVKTGDKIQIKQNLGSIIYDEEDAKTEIHLEIWKGQLKLDPQAWLFKSF